MPRSEEIILRPLPYNQHLIMIVPCLPLWEGDDIINDCAWGWVVPITEDSCVDALCYNDKGHSVWLLSIDLLKFLL
jgi:hypothetical protein